MTISEAILYYYPTRHIRINRHGNLYLTMPDGDIHEIGQCSPRTWIRALADRDEAWVHVEPYRPATAISEAEEQTMRLACDNINYLQFKKYPSGKSTLEYRPKYCGESLGIYFFPPTLDGYRDAKAFSIWLYNKNKFYFRKIEKEYNKRKLNEFKAYCEKEDSYLSYDYTHGVRRLCLTMPLCPGGEQVKRSFEATEEGRLLAIACRSYIAAKGRLPPWKGRSWSTVRWPSNNTSGEHNIIVSQGAIRVSLDRCNNHSINCYSMSEARYLRSKHVICGIPHIVSKIFVPTTISDAPMMALTTPVFGKLKKSYITPDEQQKIHDELIQFKKDFNDLNQGHEKVKGNRWSYPPLPGTVAMAVDRISAKLSYWNQYKNFFGQTKDNMLNRVLDDAPSYIHRYNQEKGTPFTFLTVIVKNIMDKFRADLRKDYVTGNPLPHYCKIDPEIAGKVYGMHVVPMVDVDEHDYDADDAHENSHTDIASIIRSDIARYVKRAEEMGVSFETYLRMCKNSNKIV